MFDSQKYLLTKGSGGRFAGSVSWGMEAHISTQWPFLKGAWSVVVWEFNCVTALETVKTNALSSKTNASHLEELEAIVKASWRSQEWKQNEQETTSSKLTIMIGHLGYK